MNLPKGIVYLVGAGPGDPGLITVRGRELIRWADVIVHDRLVSRELIVLARRDAEIFDAGKSPGDPRDAQERIHQILSMRAKAGKMIVRLKGGDPFVFGRGFEELQCCRDAGVPCVVIPGVSSAIAAPEAAGIPLTARGLSTSFAVITAEGADGIPPAYDYKALGAIETLVILMGRAALPRVVDSLLEAGRSLMTPAACIERATTHAQKVTVTTLGELVEAVEKDGLQAPMVTIIGEAAAYARVDALDGVLPLFGKRVVGTRPPSTASPLNRALRARGAQVIHCPLTRIRYLPDSSGRSSATPPTQDAVHAYDWLVFTSRHAVRGFFRRLELQRLDARAIGACRIAALGPATMEALRIYGLRADLVPENRTARGLAEALCRTGSDIAAMRFLFPCGDLARTELVDELRRCGATVEPRIVYSTVAAAPSQEMRRLIAGGVDAIIFCSPSAVRQFATAGLVGGEALIACIGPTTAAAAIESGFRVDVVPRSPEVRELVSALESSFASRVAGVEP